MRNDEALKYALSKFEDGSYTHREGKIYNSKGIEVKGSKCGKGQYLSLELRIDGQKKKIRLHRIIFALEHGLDELLKYETIDHVDGNKYNNHPSNLEGCSVLENNFRWHKRRYEQHS